MIAILKQFVSRLTHEEKIDLLAILKVAISEELGGSEKTDLGCCPRCECSSFVKKGHDKHGVQRYLCKGCGQTFSARTRGLLTTSKLEPKVWYAYAECMVDMLTLREAAVRCGVSLPTSWFMRHRLCEVMEAHLPPFRSDARMQVDSIYVSESFSGNHTFSQSNPMPRKPRKCGHISKRGISNEKICVMCGVNDFGDEFAEVVGRGGETIEDVAWVAEPFIDKGSVVTTDNKPSYPKALEALGVTAHIIVPAEQAKITGELGMVNALHGRLRKFLSRFNGVASRHLQHYLNWFCYRESFRNTDGDKRELLVYHENTGRYQTTWRDYWESVNPFADYWENVNSVLT